MAEISTSFCFICLLHLANEEGLRIETARFDGKEGEDVGCMGTIEDGEAEEEGEGDDKPVSSAQTPGPKRRRRMDEGERRDRVVGELQALRVYKVGRGENLDSRIDNSELWSS
jgi:condensin complex subunit 2